MVNKNYTSLLKYLNKFDNLPFNKLVSNYNEYEKELIEVIFTLISSFLLKNNFKMGIDGKTYFKDEVVLTLEVTFIPNTRNLLITFQELKLKIINNHIKRKINEFGLIKEIELCYHSSLVLNFDYLIEVIQTEIVGAYLAYEKTFIRSSNEFSERNYRNLYTTLETALQYEGKEEFIGKCFLLISNERIGFVYLNDSSLRKVISELKKRQHDLYSPIEIIIWLITTPLPFQKSQTLQSYKRGAEVSELLTKFQYVEELPQIIKASIETYSSIDLTVYHICTVRDFTLSFSIPTEHKEQVLPIIKNIQLLLEEQFKNGLKNCSPLLKLLENASNSIKNSNISDFVTSVIAKFGAEMLKT